MIEEKPDDFVGVADLTPIGHYRDLARERLQSARAAEDWHIGKPGDMTNRMLDENQPAGHRGYILAYSHLVGGVEHVDALFELLERGRLTPRAPYSLMRPIFEHGFWASWLLDPEPGLDRRRRGLRAEVYDWNQKRNWVEAFRLPEEKIETWRTRHVDVGKTYEAEAHKLNISWKHTKEKLNVVKELEELGYSTSFDDPSVPAFFVACWRLLSGLNHGQTHALIVASDKTNQRVREFGGTVTTSINDDWFMNLTRVSIGLLADAAARYEWLSRNPPTATFRRPHQPPLR
jgi:hypothetical protein